MKNYINEYLTEIDLKLKSEVKLTTEEINIFKDKIIYFQHERLIHLLVTLFYVLFTLIFLGLSLISYIFLILFFIGCIFLLFYIKHYFFLENAIQYMYRLYDKIIINQGTLVK